MRIRSKLGNGTMVVVRLPRDAARRAARLRRHRAPDRADDRPGASHASPHFTAPRPRIRTKHSPHLALGLLDMGLERGKVRQVGGARQQAQARRRPPSSDRTRPAGRAAESASGRETAAPPAAAPRRPPAGSTPSRAAFSSTRAVEVSRMSGIAAACTSCRYCAMNSISTRPPAAYLRSQRSASPFSLAIARAHLDDVAARSARRRACGSSTSRIDRLDPRRETRRRRDHARARQRHVLPGPGLALLIAGKAVDLRRQRAGTARRPQPHVDLVEHAVIGLRRQRADQPLGEAGEILRAVERPLAVRIRMLVVEIVDHDEIEVGGRGHLAAAEPAQRQDRGLAAARCGRASSAKSVGDQRDARARISTSARRGESLAGLLAPRPCRTGCARRSGTCCSWPNRRSASSKSS